MSLTLASMSRSVALLGSVEYRLAVLCHHCKLSDCRRQRKTMSDQQTQDPRGTLYLENPQKSDHGPPPEGCHGGPSRPTHPPVLRVVPQNSPHGQRAREGKAKAKAWREELSKLTGLYANAMFYCSTVLHAPQAPKKPPIAPISGPRLLSSQNRLGHVQGCV